MSQGFDEQLVRHVAHLARLKLSDKQLAQYGAQLSRIVDYVRTQAKAGDVVVTMGAGDVGDVAGRLAAAL